MERLDAAGVKVGNIPAISLGLAAAQQKLIQFRQAFRTNQIKRQPTSVQDGRFKTPDFQQVNTARPNLASPGNQENCAPMVLPPHLGWHSNRVTNIYRRAVQNQTAHNSPTPSTTQNEPTSCRGVALCPPMPANNNNLGDHKGSPLRQGANGTVTVPPDIALAILRQKLAAPGRIWLLLRYMDQDGRGWITAETVRHHLTDKTSPLAVCGKRQLRNLLSAGDNIFWERDDSRIWLRSLAKVAAVLGLSRLHGRSVQLPLAPLLQSIGHVRAHLYATFHSGRTKEDANSNQPQSRPISRQSLKKLSSATRRTQRLYEKRAGIRQQRNYALGSYHTAEGEQETAWQLGQAYFKFNDKRGRVGPAGKDYLAWQLPNSYLGPHNTESKGYQRRLNRQLTDLLTIGITGNGEWVSEKTDTLTNNTDDGYKKKVFYEAGGLAAKQYNRNPAQALYWKDRGIGNTNGIGRFRLWHALPAQPVDNGR